MTPTPPASFPAWLHTLSIASLGLAVLCAAAVALDETRRRQSMVVMNLVWPLCTLFGSALWLAFYWRDGRGAPRHAPFQERDGEGGEPAMALAVAKGTSHCGAGCALGDLIAETLARLVPAVVALFGWPWLFGERMFAVWALDYAVAFALGIGFQFFAIAPMRGLSVRRGLVEALKADAASITAWQLGMYGFMTVAQLLWFRPFYGGMADATQPEFWFAMQIAMLCGFVTAYPVNWLLTAVGVKEKM